MDEINRDDNGGKDHIVIDSSESADGRELQLNQKSSQSAESRQRIDPVNSNSEDDEYAKMLDNVDVLNP